MAPVLVLPRCKPQHSFLTTYIRARLLTVALVILAMSVLASLVRRSVAPSRLPCVRALTSAARPPLPPFTAETAALKVRAAEDAWNSRDPHRVSLAYTPHSTWRNRSEFIHGRPAIVAFLQRKWVAEREYRLIKELWSWEGNRIAVRFAYEWCDGEGRWWRSLGNEMWQFDAAGLMEQRHASINDVSIDEGQRLFRWQADKRPAEHPGLTQLSL